MKKILSLFVFILISYVLTLTSTPKAYADSYGSYGGGGTPTDLVINKQVKNPLTILYVENLGSSDPTYTPGSTVTFKLIVKNGSGETMSPVTIVDTLPEFVRFVSSNIPSSYNKDTNTVTMTIDSMISGESTTIELVGKVDDASRFSQNKTIFCVSNYSKVTSPARPNGDDDTAEFCISSGKENLPVAGFNDLYALIPFMTLGGIGTVLLKKQK